MTTTAELTWDSELRFVGRSGDSEILIDGNSQRGPSPMQSLAISLAGCMAIDVVDILAKGRHAVKGLRVTFRGERAPQPPKRFEQIALHFVITGSAPAAAIDRAIALSREKYCSVWHSLRQDIALTVTHEIVAG